MDIRSTVLGLYPKARITSMGRDPSSRLGRANPRSYHNINQAIDIAPIPGVKFDDYVGSLRKAGVNILEARDEVTNPSRHATGPHWHVAFGKQQDKSMFGSRPDPRRSQTPLGLDGTDPLAPAPDEPFAFADPGSIAPPVNMSGMEQIPKVKKGGMFGSGLSFGEVLAHGLMGAAAGMGNAAPLNAYYSHKREEADRQAAREVEFARLQAAREKAIEEANKPPAEVQTAMYWDKMRRENPQMFGQLLHTKDHISPNFEQVKDEQGYVREVRQDRIETKTINDVTYYKVGNDWYAAGGR